MTALGGPPLFATTPVTVVGWPGEQFDLTVTDSLSIPVLKVTTPAGVLVAQETLIRAIPASAPGAGNTLTLP